MEISAVRSSTSGARRPLSLAVAKLVSHFCPSLTFATSTLLTPETHPFSRGKEIGKKDSPEEEEYD